MSFAYNLIASFVFISRTLHKLLNVSPIYHLYLMILGTVPSEKKTSIKVKVWPENSPAFNLIETFWLVIRAKIAKEKQRATKITLRKSIIRVSYDEIGCVNYRFFSYRTPTRLLYPLAQNLKSIKVILLHITSSTCIHHDSIA